ncbi:MAG: cytochrome c [Pseudomonadota bacterium]
MAAYGVALLAVGAALAWWLTAPQPFAADYLPEHTADAAAGEQIFWAGGCASCHATPVDGKRAKGDGKFRLGGGLELDTPYGVFRVPNISSHPQDGIGSWTMLQFVNAMQRGVSPGGQHYYPAFPYTSYARMPVTDVMDLKAYLDTLPAIAGVIDDHALGFPWKVRRGLGLWKRRYLTAEPVLAVTGDDSDTLRRGQLLVEGAGHCGECHTPRDDFGGLDPTRWLAGAPNPDGPGRIPNITPAGKGVSEWSAGDISYYLEAGFTPDFDSVGGSMVAVQENMAQLTPEDREAIAAYLKAIPAVP